jgi:ATP-dependent DNA ligase
VKTTLYLRDNRKALRYWEIESDCDGISTRWGVVGGSEQDEYEEVPFGKAGRSQEEQIDSMVESRIKKRMEKGYKATIAEANAIGGVGRNELGLPRPMLATPLKKIKECPSTYYVQPKLDGHRALYSCDREMAYSRNGKPITAIEKILSELSEISKTANVVFDGELYIHGMPLQKISSLVRKRQEESDDLFYYIYDVIVDLPFCERFELIADIFDNNDLQMVRLCPTHLTSRNPLDWLIEHKRSGYEGSMMREINSPYEEGKRSKSLIKVKSNEDSEFVVFNIEPAKNGAAILICKSYSGKAFSVTCHGNLSYKQKVFKERSNYIGRSVRVEYAGLTADGVPFHPVATMWRNKGDE